MLQSLRDSLPVVEQCTYLQTGSLGPLSRPVLQAMHAAEELAACAGPAAPDGLAPLVQSSDAALAALARLLNSPVDQICWSSNTSTAMRTVIQSLRLTADDRLITSDQEHVATRALYRGLQEIVGLRVVVLRTAENDERFLADLEQALAVSQTGRAFLLLSHVSCIDGRVLPVIEAVAYTRRAGGVSLIDGAQAVGQMPVDVRNIDADFYIGSCHKWLLGPSGLGYIYVRGDRLTTFNPNWTPAADILRPTAALGEVGTTNLALRAGARVALEQIEAIGMATIAGHGQAVAAGLRAGLDKLRPVSLLGPDNPLRTTGLVGFTVAGWNGDACRVLVDRLYRDHRILIKHQPEHNGLRVSIAAFNTTEECNRLLAALGELLGNDAQVFY